MRGFVVCVSKVANDLMISAVRRFETKEIKLNSHLYIITL